MSNETPEDNTTSFIEEQSEEKVGVPEEEQITYEEISFIDQPGFKPMIGIGSLVLVSFFLLAGLPHYAEPDNGGFTMFTYTSVLWGLVIIACGFLYEYWLMKVEEGGW